MAGGTPNRLSIPPEVRRVIEDEISDLNALTFTDPNPTDEEVEALRDAVVDVLDKVFGGVDN